jgi:hypothetical protein
MLTRHFAACSVGLAFLGLGGVAQAQESTQADAAVSTDDLGKGDDGDDSGAILLAGKVGGIASFNGLKPFVHGGLDIGYVFGGLNRTIGVYLGMEYTAPSSSGTQAEEDTPHRIADGTYDWELRQKELVFQPTFLYRFTWLTDAVVPFAGIGPRMYLLESVVRGSAGGETILDTRETSTKFGFGIPLGAEIPLGPGGLMAEFLFQWGPFDHRATGDTHLGATSLFLGYRALL